MIVSVQTPVGNFQLVENVSGIPDINAFEEVALFDDLGGNPGSGTQVGTARVRAFSLHDGDYTATLSDIKFKLGLFDVNMNTGKDFDRDVKSFDGANFLADVSPTQSTLFGTASIGSGGTTITGVGTLFATELKNGDYIFLNGTRLDPVTVVNNLSATILTLHIVVVQSVVVL